MSPDDRPVTHTYSQDSSLEDSSEDSASSVEVTLFPPLCQMTVYIQESSSSNPSGTSCDSEIRRQIPRHHSTQGTHTGVRNRSGFNVRGGHSVKTGHSTRTGSLNRNR